MKKYIIECENEKMTKNWEESLYEYSDCEIDNKEFDSLEDAQKEFNKFESEFFVDGNTVKTYYKRIATLYEVIYDEDGNEINRNTIDTK